MVQTAPPPPRALPVTARPPRIAPRGRGTRPGVAARPGSAAASAPARAAPRTFRVSCSGRASSEVRGDATGDPRSNSQPALSSLRNQWDSPASSLGPGDSFSPSDWAAFGLFKNFKQLYWESGPALSRAQLRGGGAEYIRAAVRCLWGRRRHRNINI